MSTRPLPNPITSCWERYSAAVIAADVPPEWRERLHDAFFCGAAFTFDAIRESPDTLEEQFDALDAIRNELSTYAFRLGRLLRDGGLRG
jgi:hypothetical protein